MSKLLIPHGLSTAELYAFRSIEEELNKLANGGSLTKGSGQPTLTSNLQDGSLYYDYTNLNLYVFSGSTTPNAEAVVTNGVASQWRSSAGIAEASAAAAQSTANAANIAANAAAITANGIASTANAANIAANAANIKATSVETNVFVTNTTEINGANIKDGTAQIVGGSLIMGSGGLVGTYNLGTSGFASYTAPPATANNSRFAVGLNGFTYVDTTVSYGHFYGSTMTLHQSVGSVVCQIENGNSHAIRGKSTSGGRGIVGLSTGAAFHAESGTYTSFTGAHDAIIPLGDTVTIGDIFVDVLCVTRTSVSDAICTAALSQSANQKGVIGIISEENIKLADGYVPSAFATNRIQVDGFDVVTHTEAWATYKDTHKHILVNGVGEGQVNVIGESGNLAIGDLIVTSSTAGKGMKQSDDIIRSCTVAKVREAVTFSSLTEEKQVACIYLCG